MNCPPTCVIDANIVIDLRNGGLLPELFRLPFQVVAPDVTIAELREPDGESLTEYGLKSRELSDDQVQEVVALAIRYRRVSASDLSALVLARALRATLLTGDKPLRQVAEQEGVAVHGTLWVLTELVRLEVITPSQAARALRRMLAQGSRLPWEECQRLLRQWEAQ